MTNGFGAMQDYSAQVPVTDRWAIAAYIRALQFSQHASIEDVPVTLHAELQQLPEGVALAPIGPDEGSASPDAH
jgi:hypothetical protein